MAAITINNTNDIKLFFPKSLVYGPSGVGKTSLALTVKDTLVFNAEEGLLSLANYGIPYVNIKNYKQLIDAMTWLFQSKEANKFDHVMVDSISDLAEVILAEELKATTHTQQAYGKMQQTMYDVMRSLRDFKGKKITLLAKQQVIQEGIGKKCVPIMPSEKLLAQVPYYWDLVLHMHIGMNPADGSTYRAFHTRDHANWSAKDRSGKLAEIEEPHMGKIFAKILS